MTFFAGLRRSVVSVFASAALLVAVAAWPGAALASASAGWTAGVEASLPANARPEQGVSISSVSCAAAGNCSAVGGYADSSGGMGLLLSERSGRWARGVEASLPANVGPRPLVSISSVSCAAAGNCSAVGSYNDSERGLLLSESSAVWAPGVEAFLPANARLRPGGVFISSVSCAAAGNCSAVGSYEDSSGHGEGLLLSESSGVWAPAVEASLPANASPQPLVSLSSVSCAAAGNCSAVGSYADSSGHTQGLLLSESSGVWAPAVEASLPANAGPQPGVSLSSVSCAAAGNCSAVGSYYDSSGHTQGLLLSESSGVWAPGVEASLPANARPQPLVFLRSVSCAAGGNCSAVGGYVDSSGHEEGLLLSESSGVWAPAVEASLPANARPQPVVSIWSVSCAAAGNCAAVGSYDDNSGPPLSGHRQGLLLSESSGTWAPGVEASLPANARPGPGVLLSSVSCAPAGNCSAVGSYDDRAGNTQGLLLGSVPGRPTVSGAKLGSNKLRAKKGTTLKLAISQSAAIKVVIARRVKGHRVKGVCKPKARKGTRCTISVKKRTLTFSGLAGANTFKLRLRGLKQGKYIATITAQNANGKSKAIKLAFTITG